MNKNTNTQEIREKIQQADAILIGASNGLSITEGLHLFAPNQAFFEVFGDFHRKYGIQNILQGCFMQYPTEKEKWTFWSRLIHHYSGNYHGSPVMDTLKQVVGDKPYFVITSNGEMHFQLSGFDPACIYEIEGSWEHMQCSRRCHDGLYETKECIKKMAERMEKNEDITDLIPKCPVCGGPMSIHMPTGNFIPNEDQYDRLQAFFRAYHGKKLVILELGIGMRNQLIKAPLMQLTANEPNSTYITLNKGELYIPDAIKDRSYGIDGDLAVTLKSLI